MKKIYFTFLSLVIFTSISLAQDKYAFAEGDNLINLGIGVGSAFFGTGYTASLPINPSITYERGITPEISIGVQASYASYKFSETSYYYYGTPSTYTWKFTAKYFGARGSYHFNEILDLDKKFDVYGGGSLGYVVVGVSDSYGGASPVGSALGYGAFAGGKYFFSPSVGAYAELGYQSLSFLNVGISFKF